MGNPFSRPPRRSMQSDPPSFTRIDGPDVSPPAVGVPVANAVLASGTDAHLQLHASSEKQALAFGEEQTLLAMLSLRAPAAPEDVKRPPMDLVAAIDRSGSMRGEKIQLMKKTLQLLVKRAGLNANDRVSLVTFDSSVRLDMPLEPMSAEGRTQAETIIQQLTPGATTNLSGGALKAIDVLEQSQSTQSPGGPFTAQTDKRAESGQAGRTRAVMLFTDGLANEGIRDTGTLVRAVNSALTAASSKLGGPISLFTFGFGKDHNEDCLRALATGSGAGGLYYYVSGAEDIPNAFADCLGGLTSVVAQNATLSFHGMSGASVSRVLGAAYTRDAEGAVVLGDLFTEDAKDVLIELKLPKLPAEAASAPVLRAELRAFNVVTSASERIESTLTLARPASTPVDQPVNTALDVQRNRIETAEAMEEATRLADGGNIAAGREKLRAVRQRVAESESAMECLSRNLIAECETLEATYESATRYRSMGSKMSKMSAMSHTLQRATHQNTGSYSGGGKRKAALKASWISSIASSGRGNEDSDCD